MNLSNYAEEQILDHVLRGETLDTPDNIYLAIFNGNATEYDMENSELEHEVDDYEPANRPEITFDPPERDGDTEPTIVESIEDLEIEDMPSVTILYAALMDTETHGEGNIWWWLELEDGEENIESGNSLIVNPGDIKAGLD